jgi:hypothetical protein
METKQNLQDLVLCVKTYLTTLRRWATAAELYAQFGLDDRTLRTIAHASEGEILSSTHGYMATKVARKRDLEASVSRLVKQARRMYDRASFTATVWESYQTKTAQLSLNFS